MEDEFRLCKKCGNCRDTSLGIIIHEHHIIFKRWGGTDADGILLLCNFCHIETTGSIHQQAIKHNIKKEEIIEFTKRWLKTEYPAD